MTIKEKPNTYPIMYPSLRDNVLKHTEYWMLGKIIDDKTEGLWRIHDKLYNFTEFIKKHPGGSDWISLTKGTDITEAFESHHISKYPEQLLSKFFIKKTTTKRQTPFTFHDDGFYRTLKKKVRENMQNIKTEKIEGSKRIVEALGLGLFLFAIIANSVNANIIKYISIIASSVCLGFCTIAAHNFLHQRDNWRMWLFNLSGISARDWRVRHGLSHHLFANTFLDLEVSALEPFVYQIPISSKNFITRYLSWFYILPLCSFYSDIAIIRRIVMTVMRKKPNYSTIHDLIMFLIPLMMFIFGKENLYFTIINWILIHHGGSFVFASIGLIVAHHHPDIYHQGDEAPDDRDWGIYQLEAVSDRTSINESPFWVLTTFGDHGLHHLFPTLDHAILEQLHPIFDQTCKEFNTRLKMTTSFNMAVGQFQNISRVEINAKRVSEKKTSQT